MSRVSGERITTGTTHFGSNIKGAAGVNWLSFSNKLPISRDPASKQLRDDMWRRMDKNGNGYLSLAEVDKGVRDELRMPELFSAKPVMMRAFKAANNAVKTTTRLGADYVERCEFRLLFAYLRQYFELYAMFNRVDTSDDRRISYEEFVAALPLLNRWGVNVTDPEKTFKSIDRNNGGLVLFDEFAHWAFGCNLDLEDDDNAPNAPLPRGANLANKKHGAPLYNLDHTHRLSTPKSVKHPNMRNAQDNSFRRSY